MESPVKLDLHGGVKKSHSSASDLCFFAEPAFHEVCCETKTVYRRTSLILV